MPAQKKGFGKKLEQVEAADSLVRRYLLPALGGAGVTSSWQATLSAFSQPSPPWWVHGLIAAVCAVGIVLMISKNKKVIILAALLALAAIYALVPTDVKVITNRTFMNEQVALDGFHYSNCIFKNVTFTYDGGPVIFTNNKVDGFRFKTDDLKVFGSVALLRGAGLLAPEFQLLDSDGNVVRGINPPLQR